MDPICPPSTVYAAYNGYAGERDIRVWRYADHGGGYGSTPREHLAWLHARGLAADGS
ncbi:acetylxylan esterase [Streptomyces sp. NPDC020996]|uniref:acetylxylan esterase n=1 Tax=Streptomyces sp. NPDC020996 TaxID=3154791 RepID=UPI0033FEE7F4